MMIRNASREPPLRAMYDPAADEWIFDVAWGLPDGPLTAAARYVYATRKQQYEALPPGDRKEFLGRALTALREGRYQQRISNTDDITVLRPLDARRTITIGAVNG